MRKGLVLILASIFAVSLVAPALVLATDDSSTLPVDLGLNVRVDEPNQTPGITPPDKNNPTDTSNKRKTKPRKRHHRPIILPVRPLPTISGIEKPLPTISGIANRPGVEPGDPGNDTTDGILPPTVRIERDPKDPMPNLPDDIRPLPMPTDPDAPRPLPTISGIVTPPSGCEPSAPGTVIPRPPKPLPTISGIIRPPEPLPTISGIIRPPEPLPTISGNNMPPPPPLPTITGTTPLPTVSGNCNSGTNSITR